MGQAIIGFGQIDVEEKNNEVVLSKFKEMMKHEHQFIRIDDQCLDFEMQGNNYLDHSKINEFIKWAKKEKIFVEVSVIEYIQSDRGYCKSTNDEDEE